MVRGTERGVAVSRNNQRDRTVSAGITICSLVFTALMAVLLVGCPGMEGLQLRHIEHEGAKRTYYVHVPDNLPPSTSVPLVVALHRFTETGARMAQLTGFNALADDEDFIVAYPNGKGRRFNYESGSKPDDAAFVLAVIEDMKSTYDIDPSRVYVTGASNGGFLVYRLACEYPETFAAAAPVMATFLDDVASNCASSNDMPMMIIHGDADPLVPYDEETVFAGPGMTLDVLTVPEAVAFWVERNGCDPAPIVDELPDSADDGTTAVSETYLDEKASATVVHIRVRNGGHTWPGGKEHVPAFIVGKQSEDFGASKLIWEFFTLHERLPKNTEDD
jgi:polyhydroxybutyrate depolymerase